MKKYKFKIKTPNEEFNDSYNKNMKIINENIKLLDEKIIKLDSFILEIEIMLTSLLDYMNHSGAINPDRLKDFITKNEKLAEEANKIKNDNNYYRLMNVEVNA